MNFPAEQSGTSKRKIFLWAVLWAIFPPTLIIALIYSIIKPAIKGEEPSRLNYVLWVFGLIFWGDFLSLPFGSVSNIADALKDPGFSRMTLSLDLAISIASILLIFSALRKRGFPNPFLPLRKFKFDRTIFILFSLSFLPLLILLLPEVDLRDTKEMIHPLIIAFSVSLKNGSILSIVLGFLSIGLFGPIIEEFIFRGLLLEETHEGQRKRSVRFLLDGSVCLFFAAIHIPVSFFAPLLLAAAFIYVRRRTKSLLPSIFMHISWNSSILAVIAAS